MDHIAGLVPTGRKLLGPASDLLELEAENGLRHTAIVFHPEYKQHSGITDALEVVRSFIESPLVTGLVELVAHDPEAGAFVYPTGPVWSVAEIVRTLSDLGEPAGTRAGLELMYTAGQILVEGADAGSAAGVYSHGGLTPRRIMVKKDGQVMVIGHGLPQVEILEFHAGGSQVPRGDSFRYCPPERMDGRAEDVTSDLFALVLVGFELMTGKPVYDGLVNDIRQQAARAEGSRRLFRFREVVDERVRDVMTQALRPGPEARFADGDDFLDAIHGLLSQRKVQGPSLIELMEKVQGAGQRQGQRMEASSTVMVDKDTLAEGLATTEAPEGRAPEKNWAAGRRRSVRRESGNLDALIRSSRTGDPTAEVPTVTEVEATLEASLDESPAAPAPSSHRWSKVKRAPGRRKARSRAEAPSAPERAAPPSPERAAPPAPVSDAPPPPVVPDASGSDAASLLARIRGQTARSEVAVEPAPVAPVVHPPSQGEAATVMMTREQLQATVASALADGEPLTVLNTSQARDGGALVPTVSLDNAGAGGLAPFQIKTPGTSDALTVHLPKAATSAEAIGWMVGSVVPLPVDMSGRLSGWYRLQQAGKSVAPGARMSTLGEGLTLEFVPSSIASAQIEVVQGDSTVRFMSPLGTAVPVSSLVAHLLGWLGLSAGPWRLYRDGMQLSDHAILADTGPTEELTLVLRQDGE